MNPYAPTQFTGAPIRFPSLRRLRTYFDAAAIGCGLSIIAPVGNTIYCKLFLHMPALATLQRLLVMMVPTALVCIVTALVVSSFVPTRASQSLSRHQTLVPAIVNAVLFSLYFSLLGFGYIQGTASFLGYSVTHYVLAPALTAGIGTLLHIAVRPWRSPPAFA